MLIEKNQVSNDEAKLIEAINAATDDPRDKGTITIEGTEHVIKLERKLTVYYDKEKGQEHPLFKLAKSYRWFAAMMRMDPEERKAEVDKLIEKVDNGQYTEGSPEAEAVKYLKTVRHIKPAKPAIEVKPKVKPAGS